MHNNGNLNKAEVVREGFLNESNVNLELKYMTKSWQHEVGT